MNDKAVRGYCLPPCVFSVAGSSIKFCTPSLKTKLIFLPRALQAPLRSLMRPLGAGRPKSDLDTSLQSVKRFLKDASSQHMGESMHTVYGAAAALEAEKLQSLEGGQNIARLRSITSNIGQMLDVWLVIDSLVKAP